MRMNPNETNSKPVIIHQELSFKVVGVCFKTHNYLGQFCRERQYGDSIETFLQLENLKYVREADLRNVDASSPKGNFADFIIEDKILLELKAKPIITKEDYYQVQRYLQASNLDLAILVNFRSKFIHPKRILRVNNSLHSNKDSYH